MATREPRPGSRTRTLAAILAFTLSLALPSVGHTSQVIGEAGYGLIAPSDVKLTASGITLATNTASYPNVTLLAGAGGFRSLRWTALPGASPVTANGQTSTLSPASVDGTVVGYRLTGTQLQADMLIYVRGVGGSGPVHEQPLPLPRVGLGAATGADSRVYAIGGTGPKNPHDRNKERDLGVVEAYDPRRNTWACSTDDAASGCATHNLAPLPTPRHGFVVVAGADGHIYVIGGADVSGTLQTVEAFDPRHNTWACSTGDAASGCVVRNLAPLPTPRQRLVAALGGDGRIYVAGGYNPSRGYLATVEAYAPTTNTWRTEAPMPTRRGFLSAARGGDGRLYAIGGYNGRQALRTVEAYDPRRNTWTTVASLPAARDFAAAATGPGGQIYLLGGNDLTTAAYFDTVLVYNPSSDHWVTLPTRLSSARWNLAAAAHPNGLIYALGGIGNCLVDVACPTQPTATSRPTTTDLRDLFTTLP